MIKALILDNEAADRELLRGIIEEHFQLITIAGEAASVSEAIELINKETPRILFLNTEFGGETAFDFLKKIDGTDLVLIFTTADESHALKAIKFSALDYLLKPVTKEDLGAALEKIENHKIKLSMKEVTDLLSQYLEASVPKRIAVLMGDHYEMVPVNSIIRCKSDDNYTTFYLDGKRELVASKTLKVYEDLLVRCGFYRAHDCHLINLARVTGFRKGEPGFAIMDDGSEADISRRKKGEFFKRLSGI